MPSRIAVDAMGGDGGPETIVPAIVRMRCDAHIVLVGDEARIKPLLGDADAAVVHAAEVVAADRPLIEVARGMPDSSLRRALRLHAEGRVDAVVSAGDTAAFMALARQELGMIPGISRPAIIKGLTGRTSEFWMLDLGANLECSADQLVEFARMGSLMARCAGKINMPSVGLLNVGTETGKGPDAIRLAAERLKLDPAIDYGGYVEGQRLFANEVDVIVCDGFAGNIALKSVEGAAVMALHLLTQARTRKTRFKRWLAERLNLVDDLAALLDPQQYNGATLIGVRGVAIKSHGSANETGIINAVREARREINGGIVSALETAFA